MPKRKCESDSELQMSDAETTDELRTPVRGKRRRRISDVIDSMGDRADWTASSPASTSYIFGSSSSSCSTPSSVGFVTPQRNRAAWHSVASPDLGYSATPDWYKRVDSNDATVPRADDDNYSLPPTQEIKSSTHRDADKYNMQHRNRGKCIIFNHENFDTGFEPREGSRADAQRIEQTFVNLGFTVEICDDYDHSSVMNKIMELSEEDHTDNDCICIFILTHGLKNDFICAKDVVYKIDNVWKPFTAEKCVTLAGKPKLFFFQACRGDNLDGGIKMQSFGITETDSLTTSYKIPTHADFLFAYSTVQGFYSWRNPEEGTWYIQSLCDILNEHAATTDLARMLTMTARKVATQFASFNNLDSSLHDQKQVPSVTSMLIRDLYFSPKDS